MSVFTILSNHNVVKQEPLFRSGKERTNSTVRYWGENGLIHMSWEEGGIERYKSIPIKDALLRLKALNDILGKTPHSEKCHFPDEIKKLQDFIDDMCKLIRRARESGPGDPFDPSNPNCIAKPTNRRPISPPKLVYIEGFNG